jgi:hypothetical protein
MVKPSIAFDYHVSTLVTQGMVEKSSVDLPQKDFIYLQDKSSLAASGKGSNQ